MTKREIVTGGAETIDLLNAAMDALKRQAGMIPRQAADDLPQTIEECLAIYCPDGEWADGREPKNGDALKVWLRGMGMELPNIPMWREGQFYLLIRACLNHDDGVFVPAINEIEDHRMLPRINGVTQLPCVELNRHLVDTAALYKVMKMIEGRAWVAGGAVARYMMKPGEMWNSGDIDVYCWTDEDYHHLADKFQDQYSDVAYENERSMLITHAVIGISGGYSRAEINLVRPCGEDWSEPYNVLKQFDLTCSAAVLKNKTHAYVWKPSTFKDYSMDVVSMDIQHPVKTMQRITKYWARGFSPVASMWHSLAKDKRMAELLQILAPMEKLLNPGIPEMEPGVYDQIYNLALATGEVVEQGDSFDYEYEEWE